MSEDVISFCSNLIKAKSVTPNDDGALEYVKDYLIKAGFSAQILTFSSADESNSIKNLYAKYTPSCASSADNKDRDNANQRNKVLGFLGHSDVVPAGDGWQVDPFSAIQKDGYLYGRGVCDMKGGIAAFCCAVAEFIKEKNGDPSSSSDFSIVIMITGDEEIGSKEGVRSLLSWCKEFGTIPDDCLIGEPSSREKVGDRIYIGHRGSLNVRAKYKGKQGHIAYQGSYDNSLSKVCEYIAHMLKYEWKYEDKRFPKTNIEPTMLFTNNYAVNVAPDESSANLNIRYGADYTHEELQQILLNEAEKFGVSLEFSASGDAYCCDNEKLKELLSESIKKVTKKITTDKIVPEFSCAGGTSDGRHMIQYCNIIEFGLQDACIHQKNEKVKVSDLVLLSEIYRDFLERYFG